ncbi:2-dehydropantoate 2-reductase [Terriglobus saanensis]|nr:2-dehydropantoate 2-reductase [Terriglobus saanensis]
MANIAIIGVGAIGSTIAAALQQTGRHKLVLCTRRALTHPRVETPSGTVEIQALNLTDPTQSLPEGWSADWVLVVTKTYATEAAAAWFPLLLSPETKVAILQNGVEHRDRFPDLAQHRVAPVIVQYPAERKPDGDILQRNPVSLDVENTEAARAFAALFAPGEVRTHEDFLSIAWRKLCVNAAGVVSALTLRPVAILQQEAPARLAKEIAEECAAVGRAEGATLPEDVGQYLRDFYAAISPDSINSLLADRQAGRPMESDARNGVIVRLGEKHGIATPLNRMAVTLLEAK